jgi:phosphoribosylformylglycinamidine synthase
MNQQHSFFPLHFDGITSPSPKEMGDRPKAAIIREKVIRNVKWQMLCIWLVLMLRRSHDRFNFWSRNLEDIQFIGAVGGFSNSDVLGSAKGGLEHLNIMKSKYSFEEFL